MITIYLLSSRQRIAVSEDYWMNFAVFKLLHVIEYAILTTMYIFSLYYSTREKDETIYRHAVIFALCYAATDELHQTFVPTREGTIRDVGIDLIGILSVYWFFRHSYAHYIQRYIPPLVRAWFP